MLYRKAVSDDIPSLTAMRREFLAEANGAPPANPGQLQMSISDYLHRYLPNGQFIAWLAFDDGKLCATSGISFYDLPPSHSNPTGKIGYIMNMYTKPSYRHRGIASVLFEKMLEEGKIAGVGKFILNATSDGRGLYEKYGFTDTGDEMVLLLKGRGQF